MGDNQRDDGKEDMTRNKLTAEITTNREVNMEEEDMPCHDRIMSG